MRACVRVCVCGWVGVYLWQVTSLIIIKFTVVINFTISGILMLLLLLLPFLIVIINNKRGTVKK